MIIHILHRSLSPITFSLIFSPPFTTLSLATSIVAFTGSFNDLNERIIFSRSSNSFFFSLLALNK
jgi:hypothetical protein